jgi:hypothetical protein
MSTRETGDAAEITELRGKVAFGLDVEAFMNGSIGKYLQRRAQEQIDGAAELLKRVSPDSPQAIRELQNQVRVAEMFLDWLGEAVTEGEQLQRAYIEAQN